MADRRDSKKNELFSTSVKAGKRTYFFDVKLTRGNDYFLTISERKKVFNKDNGKFQVEKHRIFLYQEDFEGFINALNDTLGYINNHEVETDEIEEADDTEVENIKEIDEE